MRLPYSFRVQRIPEHNDLASIYRNSVKLLNGDLTPSSELFDEAKINSDLSPYITGELAFERQKELMDRANAFSAEQAEIARRHNIYMADTAYQRAVKDLRRAGLNPYLAYSAGGAAVSSSPSPSSSAGGAAPSDKVIETLLGSAELLATVAKLVRSKK